MQGPGLHYIQFLKNTPRNHCNFTKIPTQILPDSKSSCGRRVNEELVNVQTNVDKLVREMENAIAHADAFLAILKVE